MKTPLQEATDAFNKFLQDNQERLYLYVNKRAELQQDFMASGGDASIAKDIESLTREFMPLLTERARLFDELWEQRRRYYKKNPTKNPNDDPDYVPAWAKELDEQAGWKPKIQVAKS